MKLSFAMRILQRMALLILASTLFTSTFTCGMATYHRSHTTVNKTDAAEVHTHEASNQQRDVAVPASSEPQDESTIKEDSSKAKRHTANDGGSENSLYHNGHHIPLDPNGIPMPKKVGPFTEGDWQYAHATFYGDETAQETMRK
jgi:hypothetical protein